MRGPAGVYERAEDVEDAAAALLGELLADRGDVLERRMVGRRKEEDVAELGQRPAQHLGRGLEIDAEAGEQVGTAAFRGDAAVAVLHHRHAGAREREDDEARDVETARMVAPGADDVDRAGRPGLDAGVHRHAAESLRKRGDFAGGLALVP